jgi:protein-S-isoprenylcysteine O-methyltransferase Ste14
MAWVISWLAAARWSSRTVQRSDARAGLVYRVFTGIGAVLLFRVHPAWQWTAVALWRPDRGLAWTLVAVTLCGFALTWWARVVLGRLWSSGVSRKVDHRVMTAGPYRLVRHPIYSGIILSVLATAALQGTAAAILGAAAIVLGLFIKARIEERFLRTELGADEYDSYARHVPMLVPFPFTR